MIDFRSLCLLLVVGLCIQPFGSGLVAAELEPDALDAALFRAVQGGNLSLTETLLKQGADPHVMLEPGAEFSVVCEATIPGRSKFLSLLMQYGLDVNHWFERGGSFYGTPLACAVSNGNPFAFETLLDAGADPEADLCEGCPPEFHSSLFELASDTTRYDLMWRLVELGVVDDYDVDVLVFSFENYPPLGDERNDPYRLRLIDWLREKGLVFTVKMEHDRRPSPRR